MPITLDYSKYFNAMYAFPSSPANEINLIDNRTCKLTTRPAATRARCMYNTLGGNQR